MSASAGPDQAVQVDLKVCGITRIADLRLAERAGATCFGTIVEIARSPRSISVARAAMLGRASRIPQVCVVETAEPATITDIAAACRPAAVQLHTNADASAIAAIRSELAREIELWLAVGLPPRAAAEVLPIGEPLQRINQATEAGIARIVLDTATTAGIGGTGQVSNWQAAAMLVEQSPLPVMLAGGINPGNLAEALVTVSPQGIDVSSGVERAPGVKDPSKMAELATQFRQGVAQLRGE